MSTQIQAFLATHFWFCDRSPGKRFPNNTVSVSGFFRELKQRAGRRRRQRERETSKKGLDKQNNNFYVHHPCSYIPLPSLHDYDLKVPNFTFCGGRKHKKTIFFFSPWTSIDAVLSNSSSEKVANICRIERGEIDAVKFETKRKFTF